MYCTLHVYLLIYLSNCTFTLRWPCFIVSLIVIDQEVALFARKWAKNTIFTLWNVLVQCATSKYTPNGLKFHINYLLHEPHPQKKGRLDPLKFSKWWGGWDTLVDRVIAVQAVVLLQIVWNNLKQLIQTNTNLSD